MKGQSWDNHIMGKFLPGLHIFPDNLQFDFDDERDNYPSPLYLPAIMIHKIQQSLRLAKHRGNPGM